VEGAKLSVGDLHFCEGDGEPTTAIEMSGIVTLRVNLIRDGVSDLHLKAPMYMSSPSEPLYGEKLVFTGLSTRHDGSQTDRGGVEAYRNAAFSVIEYLCQFGYTREQVYILLAVAPIETRVVATANKPNFIISIGVPLAIFDFDIRPPALVERLRSKEIQSGS
jgi:formamidase